MPRARYIASQVVGAVLASFALWLLLPEHRGLIGAHVPAIPAAPSVAMEVILTFFVMFVILGVIGFLNAAPAPSHLQVYSLRRVKPALQLTLALGWSHSMTHATGWGRATDFRGKLPY